MRLFMVTTKTPHLMYILVLLSFFCLPVEGQNPESGNPLHIPELYPHSPEAAQLLRVKEIPVSSYTGAANISIPLCAVEGKSYTLPISISYSSSGIRVQDNSGYVGLGWSINIGGIVRQQVGALDNNNTSTTADWNFLRTEWLPLHNSFGIYRYPYEVAIGNSPIDVTNDEGIHYLTSNVIEDYRQGNGEKDIFHVSLPNGKSCSYVYDFRETENNVDYTPFLIGNHDQLKVRVSSTSNSNVYVYDTDGTEYMFSPVNQRNSCPMNYLLSSIVTVDMDTITIQYQPYQILSIPVLSEVYLTEPVNAVQINRTLSVNNTYDTTFCLQVIKSATMEASFSYTPNNIKGPTLNEIIMTNTSDNSQISKHIFSYSTFEYCNNGGNYLSATDIPSYCSSSFSGSNYSNENLGYRLKLTEITSYGSQNINGEKYSFEYNSTKLPLKTSYAQDFWGYYNGKENTSELTGCTHTMIPNTTGTYPIDNIGLLSEYPQVLSHGANRHTSRTNVTAGMLSKVIYPTGGYDIFTFESNTFNNYNIPCIEDYNATGPASLWVFTNNHSASSTPVDTFSIERNQQITVKATLKFKDYTFNQVSASKIVIHSITNPSVTHNLTFSASDVTDSHIITKTFTLDLTPGQYSVLASLVGVPDPLVSYANNDNILFATVSYVRGNTNHSTNSYGGGTRIKEITTYDNDNTLIQKITYDYNNGILLQPCNVAEKIEQNEINNSVSRIINYWRFSSNMINSFSCNAGGTVGYPCVTKRVFAGNEELRKEEYNYSCTEGETYHQYNYTYYHPNTNGSLLSSKIYEGEQLLQKQEYGYNITNNKALYCNIHITDRYTGDIPRHYTGLRAASPSEPLIGTTPRYLIRMAPCESYNVNNIWQRTVEYFDTDSIVTTKDMNYNELKQLTKTITTQSGGNTRIDSIQYLRPSSTNSQDYVHRFNYVDKVKEENSYINNNNIKLSYDYTTRALDYVPFLSKTQIYRNGTAGEFVSYVYDNKYNIVEIMKNGVMPTTFLWGYKGTKIVAVIEGCSYSNACSLIGQSVVDNIKNASSFTSTYSDAIRNALSNYYVTTYEYKLGIGMTKTTDRRKIDSKFEYDGSNRLSTIKKHNDVILHKYTYHYVR